MNYRTRIISSLAEVGAAAWDGLLATQAEANPFLSYAFLHALHESGSATPDTGWQPQYLTLWSDDESDQASDRASDKAGDGAGDEGGALAGDDADAGTLQAAMPLYVKSHSYGEYVFDWAWADAYQRNGLDYYPKLLSAVPFTPVSGTRLLARDATAQAALIKVLQSVQRDPQISSTHVLYPPQDQADALHDAGFLLRSGVQFHWRNAGYASFDDFLATLERKKSKNIRAERRKVAEAGVTMHQIRGADATEAHWEFFHRCYSQTYAEHHSSPYLNLDFFLRIAATMPHNLLLVMARHEGRPIASSLVVHTDDTLYGRYWGALEHVPCLHFETAYYQPLEFCIANKIALFEGGAQGEHKMARGFLPTKTWSAHWLAQPAFANAVQHFLERESGGIEQYIDELNDRTPFKNKPA